MWRGEDYIILWLLLAIPCAIAGGFAGSGRSAAALGAVLGAILGPLGVLAALGLDHRHQCPYCFGRLNGEAELCPHCQSAIEWTAADGNAGVCGDRWPKKSAPADAPPLP